jgi:hypothetical protein
MARPRKSIDPKDVTNYAKLGFSNAEIAQLLDTTPAVLERRFAPDLKAGRRDRAIELRTSQYEAAKNGRVSILTWLARQEAQAPDRKSVTPTPSRPYRNLSDVELDERIGRELVRVGLAHRRKRDSGTRPASRRKGNTPRRA